jgi:hypothetical protein
LRQALSADSRRPGGPRDPVARCRHRDRRSARESRSAQFCTFPRCGRLTSCGIAHYIGALNLKRVAMRPDHPRIFFWSAGISFAATSLYPLMLLTYTPNNFRCYIGLDVAWSIYVWLFVPMSAGITTVLLSDLFRFRIPKLRRPLWSAGLFIFAALVGWGAWQDRNRLPAPQMIAAINGVPVGDFAIRVDQCLRDSDTCAGSGLDQAELVAQAGLGLFHGRDRL